MTSTNLRLGTLMFTIGLLLSLALTEGLLRVYAAADPVFRRTMTGLDPLAVLIEPHGELGYRQKPGAVFRYLLNKTSATTNARGYRGPVVATAKSAGTLRIVLVGGSTTHGWGVNDSATIDEYMRRLLAVRLPGRAVEVVNLGFDGYDSYQLFERLRSDGVALDPDVVVVNEGINDVRNARFPGLQDRDPRTLIWEVELRRLRAERAAGGPSAWNRAKHLAYLLRLPAMLRARMDAARRTRPAVEMRAYPEAADYFERNLLRIAGLFEGRPVALVLSTQPSGIPLRYDSAATSVRDYWVGTAAMTQRYRDTLAARMQSVAERLRGAGRRVAYVHATMSGEHFLDDAHLDPEGNALMARAFVEALLPLLDSTSSRAPGSPRRAPGRR